MVGKHRKTEPEPQNRREETRQEAAAQQQENQAPPAEPEQMPGHEDTDPEQDEVDQLRNALEESRSELDRHREAMLRMQAEMENQRKRLAREMEKSRRFALERMMKDLLQVRDSLERGLEVDEESATVEGLRQGKALTLKMLSKVMQDHGLEVIDPQGERFNPELHEAMSMVPSTEYEENTVVEVLQKGFRLHDRLIRPAMVMVSKQADD